MNSNPLAAFLARASERGALEWETINIVCVFIWMREPESRDSEMDSICLRYQLVRIEKAPVEALFPVARQKGYA